ncbi:hypothetical protein C1645_739057 [Glomus cerebriforme]|uniref:Uncharacterized protein n=1 Tax=Glomus cerebriforme TaxID=658196 RepID=A0A397SYI1_9GLOM|nr:hypothetical protein C1645_739057 [Glomus cerebriforme]
MSGTLKMLDMDRDCPVLDVQCPCPSLMTILYGDILDQLTERELERILKESDKAHKKIYNPKTNHMIIINGPVYHKLLLREYMYWKEERLRRKLENLNALEKIIFATKISKITKESKKSKRNIVNNMKMKRLIFQITFY